MNIRTHDKASYDGKTSSSSANFTYSNSSYQSKVSLSSDAQVMNIHQIATRPDSAASLSALLSCGHENESLKQQ
jgi:hypothetical protein